MRNWKKIYKNVRKKQIKETQRNKEKSAESSHRVRICFKFLN